MSSLLSANQRARTKIVATVGPACAEEAQLVGLQRAGVDVFRLNTAHGDIDSLEQSLLKVRRASEIVGWPIGVLVDLAGPKIRLGEIADGAVECRLGETFHFVRGATSARPDELVSTYDRLVDELTVGSTVMLADGTVGMKVEAATRDAVTVRVVQEGLIRSRQGINLPGVDISLPALSEDDRRCAEWAAKAGADFIGLSFVRRPNEVRELKELVRGWGSPARVIAKIEKSEALDCLEEIILAADGVMVARGDLGVEIDVARVPVVQKQIVAACTRLQKPVIIATQMLDSMQHARRPTRAEATDVANAILDGCDACMLSGETAIGDYPQAAVEMMNRIALVTELSLDDRPPAPPPERLPEGLRPVTQAVIVGANHVAHRLKARLIVVASHSGATALALAKQRSAIITVGVSDSAASLRQFCLYWGVVPLMGAPAGDPAKLLEFLTDWGRRDGTLVVGDWLVLVTGDGLSVDGHNGITAHQVQG